MSGRHRAAVAYPVARVRSFQSAPARMSGRHPVIESITYSSSTVSIRARSDERAKRRGVHRCRAFAVLGMFQSAPARMSGRNPRALVGRPRARRRPVRVSIRARSDERAKPVLSSTERVFCAFQSAPARMSGRHAGSLFQSAPARERATPVESVGMFQSAPARMSGRHHGGALLAGRAHRFQSAPARMSGRNTARPAESTARKTFQSAPARMSGRHSNYATH